MTTRASATSSTTERPRGGYWRVLLLLALLLCRPAANAAAVEMSAANAAAVEIPAEPAPLAVQAVAAGVWVHVGQIGDFAPANGGDLANLGFVVGSRCVAVIDTGGAARVGAALLAAVRRQTALPVCYVIATHMHPDHLLGHAAFVAERPMFVAAAHQPQALAARAEGYLARQRAQLGSQADGSRLIQADRLVADNDTLDLGGRSLQLRAWRTAHTNNDLTVQDGASGVLFTGDLLFRSHLPVIDGSLSGWLAVLPQLVTLATAVVVPGHGPVGQGAGAFVPEQAYLAAVATEVRAALKAGRTLAQTVDATRLPADWQLTELYHRRNVTAAYAELEWQD